MFILVQSSIMIFIMLAGVGYLFYKSKNVSKFNVAIYIVLLGMYISESLLGSSIKKDGASWEWPLLASMFQLTQAITRLPFGKLSQKLKSRKIPLMIAMLLMLIFSIPLAFEISFATLFPAIIGLGIVGGSYGMQNQYWSENFNIRSVFLSVAIIFTLPMISSFVTAIITYEFPITGSDFNKVYVRQLMVGFLILLTTTIIGYMFIKEKKDTIRLDNVSSYAKVIKKMNILHVLSMSMMIVFISFAVNMISLPSLINGTSIEFKVVKVAGYTLISILGLISALVLIKIMKQQNIVLLSHILLLIGFTLMIIGNFGMKSFILSTIGYLIIVSGTSMFTISMIGTMLHFDHKNSFLVLGIWLSIKSFSLGTGTLAGGELALYQPLNVKYLLIVGLILSIISQIYFMLVSRKYVKPVFDVVKKLEYKKYHIYGNKMKIAKK